MERPVFQPHPQAVYFETGQRPVLHGFAEALLHRGDVFLGNVTAFNLVDKLQAGLAFFGRLHGEDDIGEFTASTGLLLVHLAVVATAGDGFFVLYLGLALVYLYLEFATHAVYDDIKVQLSHPGDDGLPAGLVGLDLEGRVFLGQLGQGHTHFIHVGLGLGLHSNTDHGVGEHHAFQHDGVFLGAQGVAGLNILESDRSPDVSGRDALDGILLVGVHLVDAGNTFLVA